MIFDLMKGNNRNPGQSERSGPSSRQQLRGKGHEHEPVCPTPLRVVVGVLVLLLLVISAIGSLAVVKNSYAASECSLPLICQSPTPSPSPSPTNTSTPRPSPTRSTLPAVSSPTTGASPSATTSLPTATSTATATRVTQTPGASPTSAPALTGGSTGNKTPGQSGGSGAPRVVMIVAITFLGLLLCLGVGMFVFRRMLLPPIDVKLPSSGARRWSRTRVPDPYSLGGNNNAEETQATRNATLAFAAANNRFGPGQNGFERSDNGYAPLNRAVAHMQQGFDPTQNGFGPHMQGFESAYHDSNAPTLAEFGPQDMNSLPNDPFTSSQGGDSG